MILFWVRGLYITVALTGDLGIALGLYKHWVELETGSTIFLVLYVLGLLVS